MYVSVCVLFKAYFIVFKLCKLFFVNFLFFSNTKVFVKIIKNYWFCFVCKIVCLGVVPFFGCVVMRMLF